MNNTIKRSIGFGLLCIFIGCVLGFKTFGIYNNAIWFVPIVLQGFYYLIFKKNVYALYPALVGIVLMLISFGVLKGEIFLAAVIVVTGVVVIIKNLPKKEKKVIKDDIEVLNLDDLDFDDEGDVRNY